MSLLSATATSALYQLGYTYRHEVPTPGGVCFPLETAGLTPCPSYYVATQQSPNIVW